MNIGLIGPGTIAAKFAEAAKQVEGVNLTRIASSRPEKAAAFAAAHGTGMPCSYENLLKDPSVDAVYIAVINTRHYEMTRRCLEAGKPVLCEKPFCLTPAEEKELFDLAKQKGLLLMEGMWTLFLPCIRRAAEWIREGKIGTLSFMDSAFCFYNKTDPAGRLFDPAKAGGGLYDVGIYTLAFSLFMAGAYMGSAGKKSASGADMPAVDKSDGQSPGVYPGLMQSALTIGPTGVDTAGSALLSFADGFHAQCEFGVQTADYDDAHISGTDGYIVLPQFWGARKATLYSADREVVETAEDPRENGFTYEIEAFRDAWLAGKKEVNPVNHWFSLELAELMQEIREQNDCGILR